MSQGKNIFHDDLAYSHRQEDQPWWEDVYKAAFPLFDSMDSVRNDRFLQNMGIDRVVMLKSDRALYIDEKVRRQDYSDIAIEYKHEHVTGRQSRGWIRKLARTDFIAYAFEPSRTCYLLPFQPLQCAWKKHGAMWLETYRIIRARNPRDITLSERKTTYSVAIPVSDLMWYLTDALTVMWN